MPTPGTKGKIPDTRKTVTGVFRITAKMRDKSVSTRTAIKVAMVEPRDGKKTR